MAKLRNAPIGPKDLLEYLEVSDFAFELACVERISQLGFRCEHGGSYVDPVTQKVRQFDIRARKEDNAQLLRVRCAIECKNLSESFPLLVMCVPRPPEESFHELVFAFDPRPLRPASTFDPPALRQTCYVIRVGSGFSEYRTGFPVGKSLAQVGRTPDSALNTNDAEVYEKWSQALASATDLANEAALDGERYQSVFFTLVLPILVVPNGTLWGVDYSHNGTRNSDPVRIDRCSFFIGREYYAGERMRGAKLTISHLEFVTLSGLEEMMKSPICAASSWFPTETIRRLQQQADQGRRGV